MAIPMEFQFAGTSQDVVLACPEQCVTDKESTDEHLGADGYHMYTLQ